MSDQADRIIEIECPHCHAALWIDTVSREVVQHKKSQKKTFSTLEEMLTQEKEKKEKADERFIQARHLEQSKKKKAEDLFKEALKQK